MAKVGRNDLCPCGSGKKHKKCCGGITKPVGSIGVTAITPGPTVSVTFKRLDFPKQKADVERFIVDGFLRVADTEKLLPDEPAEVIQNDENNLDFTITFKNGKTKLLELMEVAPLEHLRGSYASATKTYDPYDFAEYIFSKLMKKSDRYSASASLGLLLLIYITDWRFTLHEKVTDLLRYWSATKIHSFEGIYCYYPVSVDDGIVELIFPFSRQWDGFTAELYKGRTVINLDPQGWKLNVGPGR